MPPLHPRYHEWLTYVFDHPVTDPQWYFKDHAPDFTATAEDFTDLITQTFTHAGRDLTHYTDAQVNQGIWYLASPSGSDHIFALQDPHVPLAKKIACIQSTHALYSACFAQRCGPTLDGDTTPPGTPLNPICYMFWDICPLSYLETSPHKAALTEVLFTTFAATLTIPHRACIQGALHGIGHHSCYHPQRVFDLITHFIDTTPLDPELSHYAEAARTGSIQ